ERGVQRHYTESEPLAAGGKRQLDLGETMPVGRDGPEGGLAAALGGVEIDAVEMVAVFLGRDGKPRLLDEPLQVSGRHRKAMVEILDTQRREIICRQRLQRE